MAATLHIELVAPERVLFSGEVESVLLPGAEGDMTVLPGHAPVMSMLKTGFVVMTNHKDEGSRVLVQGGFAEINGQGVTVLAERATPLEELTPDTIDAEIRAVQLRKDATEDEKLREAADAMIAALEEAKAALKF